MLRYSRIILLYVFFLCAFTIEGPGQDPYILDSLEHALDTAQTEQAKLHIRYSIAVEKGTYDAAFWEEMIRDARQAGDVGMELASLDRMGFYLTMQGDLKNAVVYLNRAINVAAASTLPNSLFAPLYHITDLYLLQGDIKNAINYGFRTLRYAEHNRDKRNRVISYSMLGKLYSRMGYPQKALKWHLQGLELSEKYKLDADIVAVSLHGAGMDYCELGDTANALPYLYKCRRYIDSLAPCALQAALYNAVGMSYDINHRRAEATPYYLASYRIGRDIDSKVSQVTTLSLLAANAFSMDDIKKAKEYAEHALQLAKAMATRIQLPRIALLLKKIYEKEHNYREALRYNDLYILYRDSLTSENIQQQAMEREYQEEMEQKENQNRLLAKQNRIQELELRQKNYLATALVTGIVLLTVIFLMLGRQRSIRADRQKISVEHRLLRTQMNPHFIFNALQAIQNIVLNADKKLAVKYLSSFSRLTREVLENSREDMITLSKEILLVEHYLQLQKLRFGDRFEYRICKPDDIDDNILIPPMLGQPFIENAVEHGMRKVEAGGFIEVRYELIDGDVCVRITDNGYGMNADARNNKQHQSVAIAITRERIEIMNKKQKLKTSFEIQDAFPAEKERKGVCVIFTLPVILAA